MSEFIEQYGSEFFTKLFEHLYISATALLIGSLIAIPLGVIVSRDRKSVV